MMHLIARLALIGAFLSLFIISQTAVAQGNSGNAPGKVYGKGQPRTTGDLPPGQLRKMLEDLPAEKRGKALGWLQDFSFPENDVDHLKVDSDGNIFYEDAFTLDSQAAGTTGSAAYSVGDAAQVFSLHSKPGASKVFYLDFDGHTITKTAWSGGATLVALPFDPSGNDSPSTVANFTAEELNIIAEVWHRIAEDYAAFDIDITTEEPEAFNRTTGRMLFTRNVDANGQPMPSQNAGGTAFVSVFGHRDYVKKYSPAFAYYPILAAAPNYMADAASHEIGHNLGLSHDGVIGGTAYYDGHGYGLVSWAPIMGLGYYNNVTQWSQGEYDNANNPQDDVAIIAGFVGFAADDHGNTASGATAIVVEPDGEIIASSPEFDPDNVLPNNKGIIEDRDDVDWFFLDLEAAGSIAITATPAWHSYPRNDKRGANLDIELSLMNSKGRELDVSEPDDETNASVFATVTAGRYYLQVDGVGNQANSDYSDYGSTGMYFIEGFVATDSPDSEPPLPATMAWQSSPSATGSSSITMTAVEATDDSGGIQYYFSCTAGGSGCTDSGWQSSRSHTATGLDEGTFYSYRVKSRDAVGNENQYSVSAGDTTESAPEPTPNVLPDAVARANPDPAVINRGKTARVTLDGSDSSDPDGTINSWTWRDSSGATIGTGSTLGVSLREGTHSFTLTVTDNAGGNASTAIFVAVTKNSSGGGKGKKK
jgi:hypothetical protein